MWRSLFVGVLIAAAPSVVQAVGVSPARIDIDDMLVDTAVMPQLQISRGNAVGSEVVTIDVETQDDIEIDIAEQIVLEPGQQSMTVPIAIRGERIGEYVAALRVTPVVETTAEAQRTIPGVVVPVQVRVTDVARQDLHIHNTRITREENGQYVVRWQIENRGNIPDGPTAVRVTLRDRQTDAVVTMVDQQIDSDVVAPLSTREQSAVVDIDAPKSLYVAEIVVYTENGIHETHSQSLVIGSSNETQQVDKQHMFVIVLVIAGVLLAGLGGGLLYSKKTISAS